MKITNLFLLSLIFLITMIPTYAQEPSFDDQLVSSEEYTKLVTSEHDLTIKINDLEKTNSDLTKKLENLTSQITELKDNGIKFGIDEDKLGKAISDNQRPYNGWSTGDLLIASSTIVAFFTFGSFIVIKFESDKRPHQLKILKVVFKLIFVIQAIHLLAMILIVTNTIGNIGYAAILVFTGYLLLLMLMGVTKIVELENREKTKNVETTKSYDTSMEYFDALRENLKKQREDGE